MNKVKSPITLEENVTLEKNISTRRIINKYKSSFNIDTSSYFTNLRYISIYRCDRTNYRFYYPFNLSGDGSFYEHFQQFDWYYMPWKWEHEITLQYIKEKSKILEIGCAHGAFLEKVTQKFNLEYSFGLELNESSICKNPCWEIKNQTIQSFSKTNTEKFDIVCSYQVLEHISNVKTFIESSIDCLKKDGLLIVSVPNNESKMVTTDAPLNNPPHHMGLWDHSSLKALEMVFPMKLVEVHYEDLQLHHINSYVNAVHYSKKPKFPKIIMKRIHKVTGKYENRFMKIKSNRENILGHSILAVYRNNNI